MCGSDREGEKKGGLSTQNDRREKEKKKRNVRNQLQNVCTAVLTCVHPRERRVRCCSPPVVRVFPDVKPRIRNESETMKKKRHIKETLFQTRKRTQPSTCKLKSATASWRHAHPFTGACMCVCVCVHRHQTAMTAARQTSFMQHRGVDVRTGYFHNGIKHRKQKKKKQFCSL